MSAAKEKCPRPVRRKALNAKNRRSDYINFLGFGYCTKREALKTVAVAAAVVGMFFAVVWGTSYCYGIFRGWWTWPW